MRAFAYERPQSLAGAIQMGLGTGRGATDAPVQFLAGGTTLIDLMKLDVIRPLKVVDLGALSRMDAIEVQPTGLRLGALAKMATVASHPEIRVRYPVISQSLELAASPQLRNMATLGGNVLQKTRCPYFRDPTWSACNKRLPGSGCTALTAPNRNHAVLGVDDSCISQYPGDFAIALIALDAQVQIQGHQGARRMAFASLHQDPQGRPDIETTLEPGDVIVAFEIPSAPWAARSVYLKIRDRASYEFAIASVAVALDLQGETIREARIGLGGMAYRPWRALAAEQHLAGQRFTEARAEEAAAIALAGARTSGQNAYKPRLAREAIVRALLQARAMTPPGQATS
jgi:xanthine dehydrogenase YagS FAD-binding subunit